MTPRVVVLDHGSGNLRSATRALEAAGATVELTADQTLARTADGLVVPGVGAFATCMDGVTAVGARTLIAERVAAGRPTLGICVGHQIMFERGMEHGVVADGLALLPGDVTHLPTQRVPHMGWNTVRAPRESVLFGPDCHDRFYFVHSYGVVDTAGLRRLTPPAVVTTATHQGATFVAAVEWGALSSVQFHPEKSGDAGVRLLTRWVASLT